MKNEGAERTYEVLLDRWMDLVASRASLAEAVEELCELREQDVASSIRARHDAEVLGELDDRELAELLEIRDAVARIESGRFGRCVKCSEKIAPARLEATPWVATCLACAKSEPRPWRACRERAAGDPHHLASRMLMDATEAAPPNDEPVALYPRALIYEPDELLHDHLRRASNGEDEDE